MSYDLMVFDGAKAPENKKEFMRWYERQVEWNEDHDYSSPEVCPPALTRWFLAVKESFPPMNGEFAPDPDAFERFEDQTADYSFGREMIYAGFAWSAAEEARALAKKLAARYGLGFFDASSGELLFAKRV